MLLDFPKVKLTTIFKVPEVPKKPVIEEKPAIPVAKKVESPPAEGTHGATVKLPFMTICNSDFIYLLDSLLTLSSLVMVFLLII